MDTRTRSIRRNLALRTLLAASALTLIVGAATWLAERGRIAAAIEERATSGVELIRTRVRQLARDTGVPWPSVVPLALERLGQDMPAARLGRFAFVEILDADGRPLAAAGDASGPGRSAVAAARGLRPEPGRIEVARVRESPVPGTVAVAANVADPEGRPLARIHGVFIVARETIADAERRLLAAVLGVVAIVAVTALSIYPLVRRLVMRLADMSVLLLDSNLETLRVLGGAIAKRDSDTDAHNYRVTIYSVRLAEACGADGAAIRRLLKGAFLHDVGKIGIRDHILLKPGRLDAGEFELMKTHVSQGLDIVASSAWLSDAREVIGCHHEQYAGTGYDLGLRGEAIPLTARIFAIADVFDALASERPYKKPMTVEESIAALEQGAGRHFDPGLVARFAEIAPGLYARFGLDAAAARAELEVLLRRHFRTDLGVILKEAGGA